MFPRKNSVWQRKLIDRAHADDSHESSMPGESEGRVGRDGIRRGRFGAPHEQFHSHFILSPKSSCDHTVYIPWPAICVQELVNSVTKHSWTEEGKGFSVIRRPLALKYVCVCVSGLDFSVPGNEPLFVSLGFLNYCSAWKNNGHHSRMNLTDRQAAAGRRGEWAFKQDLQFCGANQCSSRTVQLGL